MRSLALDVGEKRIGVALSDETGLYARPLTVIERRSRSEDFGAIEALVREWEVELLVVGLPTTSEGEVGRQAKSIKRYTRDLMRHIDVPLEFVDESLSTVDAQELMATADWPQKKRREWVDAVAAAVILQSYLDRKRAGVRDGSQRGGD